MFKSQNHLVSCLIATTLLFGLFFFYPPFLYSMELEKKEGFLCGRHKMRVVGEESIEIRELLFCYNALEKTLYSNIDCKSVSNCTALKKGRIQIPWENLKGSRGTPSVKACLFLNGKFDAIEVFDKESQKWIEIQRCLFTDKSYLDLGTLMSKLKILENVEVDRKGFM